MKKTILALLAGVSFAATAQTQSPITLKWADYGRFPPATDQVLEVPDLLPLANIRQAQRNGRWDLTQFTSGNYDLIRRDSVQVINSGGMPGYVYRQSEKMSLGNIYYPGTAYYLRDTFALVVTGKDIDAAAIGIDSLTGVPTDSVFILQQQTNALDSPERMIQFPATLDSTWTSTSRYSIGYQLTVAAAQYNHRPLTREVTKRIQGEVIGWGKAQIFNPATGRASDSIEVLQVQIIEVKTSHYIGADPVVLNALNLQEGSAETTSYIWLMRKGETTPLLSVRYQGVPSSTPEMAFIHTDRIPTPLAVTPAATIAATDAVRLYPNPVRKGGLLFVDCETAGAWQMRLASLTGQQVYEAHWNQQQAGAEALQMPQNLAEGLYIFQLSKNGQPVKAGRILLSE